MLRNGGGASAEEEDILGKFEWNKNEAVVHWDEKVGFRAFVAMPR
jgi:predicted NAD/FAD-binding protein